MTTEQRVLNLETKIAEQESAINELVQTVVNQQGLINNQAAASNETQEQLNSLMETVLLLLKKME